MTLAAIFIAVAAMAALIGGGGGAGVATVAFLIAFWAFCQYVQDRGEAATFARMDAGETEPGMLFSLTKYQKQD